MEVGDGLKVTQIRLGTARLTHCMRWLGLAKRCLDIALDYVSVRENHGRMLADRSTACRGCSARRRCRSRSDASSRCAPRSSSMRGDFARKEVSMAKVVVADALHHAVDTGIQLCGARGYSKDTPLEWIYRYARQARLVDGASEVHKGVLARRAHEGARRLLALGRLKRETTAGARGDRPSSGVHASSATLSITPRAAESPRCRSHWRRSSDARSRASRRRRARAIPDPSA